jgi:hypothetical protein
VNRGKDRRKSVEKVRQSIGKFGIFIRVLLKINLF